MLKNILSADSICKTYHQSGAEPLQVLNDISLDIAQGEMVALVGPSGSGKSTLLHILGLLDNATSGALTINGQEVSQAKDKQRTAIRCNDIGFIYQFHHLLPEFSALENVVMPQMINGIKRKQAIEKAKIILDRLGLSHRFNHRPATLSGGEQQRVAIARALANQPSLLLADEPTGNLDPETAEHVFDLFTEIVKETGVAALIATHNMDLAKRMDRVIWF